MLKRFISALLVVLFVVSLFAVVDVPNSYAVEGPPLYKVVNTYKIPAVPVTLNYSGDTLYTYDGHYWIIGSDSSGKKLVAYELNLSERSIAKKVQLGNIYTLSLVVKDCPSQDGKYMYTITSQDTSNGQITVNAVGLNLLDGSVWGTPIITEKNENIIYNAFVPDKYGVIAVFTDYATSKTTIVQISESGNVIWQKTVSYQTVMAVTNGKIYTYPVDNKGEYIVYDLKNGDEETKPLYVENTAKFDITYPVMNDGMFNYSSVPLYVVTGTAQYDSKGHFLTYKWGLDTFNVGGGTMFSFTDNLPWYVNSNGVKYWGDTTVVSYGDKLIGITLPLNGGSSQFIYVIGYNKQGNPDTFWHQTIKSTNKYRIFITASFTNGMLLYGSGNTLYEADAYSGKIYYKVPLSQDFITSTVVNVEKDGTVWVMSNKLSDYQSYLYLTELKTDRSATLVVRSATSMGHYAVYQNGQFVVNAHFNMPINFKPGTYTLKFYPSSVSGLEAPSDMTVTLTDGEVKVIEADYKDIQKPVVEVDPIKDPTVTNGVAYYVINGKYSDNYSGVKDITVNGVEATLQPTVGNTGTFTATVKSNNAKEAAFTIIVTDNSGNVDKEVVFYDKMPPNLTIISPTDSETVNKSTIIVSGEATDKGSGVSNVTVNGNTVIVGKDGSFSTTVSLTEGDNTITITATDKAGNKATKTITVTYKPQTVITLQPDNPYMTVNGIQQEIDPGRGTKPVIIPKWGRTVVPIRAIVEALGGTIEWDGTERKVTINFNGTVIELWIDKPQARVNGEMKWIDPSNHDVKPIIINSRTMLPLRFVAENLGCTVNWDAATRTITITYTP